MNRTAAQGNKVRRDGDVQRFDVIGRTAPYFVLECVVAPGNVETISAVVRGEKTIFRVGLERFEKGVPTLFISERWDWSEISPDELPRPFPLDVPIGIGRLGFRLDSPIDGYFDRARIAPPDRPTGCIVSEPDGEAPPPFQFRQAVLPLKNTYAAPPSRRPLDASNRDRGR